MLGPLRSDRRLEIFGIWFHLDPASVYFRHARTRPGDKGSSTQAEGGSRHLCDAGERRLSPRMSSLHLSVLRLCIRCGLGRDDVMIRPHCKAFFRSENSWKSQRKFMDVLRMTSSCSCGPLRHGQVCPTTQELGLHPTDPGEVLLCCE
jgi:hypothetical protein